MNKIPYHTPISIPPEVENKARQFAINCRSKYSWRGQNNPEKIIQDITSGKVAEEMVYRSLISLYPDLTPPDYQVYSAAQKNYNPDLGNSQFFLAVKTQDLEAEKRYGRSWVFEITDKEIFVNKDPRLYVVLTSLDWGKNLFYIRGIVGIDFLHRENLFQPMRLDYLKSKRAVYGTGHYRDLSRFKEEELEQLPLPDKKEILEKMPAKEILEGKPSLRKTINRSFFRYPGGKGKLILPIITELKKKYSGGNLIDGFIGGGSIFLGMAENFPSSKLFGNDKDPWISSVWKIIVGGGSELQELIKKIKFCNPNVELFYQMREKIPEEKVEKAFYGIFFNRTSFSGILKAGPIGGKKQESKYKINCRYNPEKLIKQIEYCHSLLKNRTEISCEDIMNYSPLWETENLAYLDPPYYNKADQLYNIYMKPIEHINLAEKLKNRKNWILSLDNCPNILELYQNWSKIQSLETKYSISNNQNNWVNAKELLILG